MIEMRCPSCSYKVCIPDSCAGKQGRCMKCGAMMTAPTPSVPAAQPADVSAPASTVATTSVTGLVKLTCPGCGGLLEETGNGLLRCPFCKTQAYLPEPGISDAEHTSMVCPDCHKDDRVQRVKAVVASAGSTITSTATTFGAAYSFGVGTQPGTLTVGNAMTSTSGQSLTNQGQRLKMWDEPAYKSAWTLGSGVGVFLAIVFCVASLASGGWWIVVGIALLAVAVSIVVYIVRRNDKQKVQVAQQKTAWERQRQRWAQLFYCHRCDCVFHKGDKEGVPPEQMSVLLQRP